MTTDWSDDPAWENLPTEDRKKSEQGLRRIAAWRKPVPIFVDKTGVVVAFKDDDQDKTQD